MSRRKVFISIGLVSLFFVITIAFTLWLLNLQIPDCCMFIPVAFVWLGFLLLFTLDTSLAGRLYLAKPASWKTFAASNDLVFDPGGLFRSASICGNYRGYEVKLDTFFYASHAAVIKHFRRRDVDNAYDPYTRLTMQIGELKDDNTFNQPPTKENVTNLFKTADFSQATSNGIFIPQKHHRGIYYVEKGIKTDPNYLHLLLQDLTNLAQAYSILLTLGAEAIPALAKTSVYGSLKLEPIVTQLLYHIGLDTMQNLSHQASNLVCLDCLTRYGIHQVYLSSSGEKIEYCGCRLCRQSRKYFKGRVIAVLDQARVAEPIQQGQVMRVNWLSRRDLFDFDEIEVIEATDEDVERFAVQVGNDTDEVRKPRYENMPCTIASDCKLSENTMRILRQMFGRVEINDLTIPSAG